jgi:DNA-binding response OmpR family regulator
MSKILVVDDERDMCRMISSFLRDEGYSVDKAYDAKLALGKIATRGYDLVIADYKLPDLSGITFLAEVRLLKPDIRVIMISAYGSDDVKATAKKHGVTKFLDKPFDLSRLVKFVKVALDKKVQDGETALPL